MADDFSGPSKTSTPSKSSSSSSPSKPGWVQFEAEDAPNDFEGGRRSSSGVSSARGSVKSISEANSVKPGSSGEGASIQVSEIQVVDEHTLRKKQSAADSTEGDTHHQTEASPFKKMSPRRSAASAASTSMSESMDNVNLSDEAGPTAAANSTSPEGSKPPVRGRTFANGEVIVTLLPVNEQLPWITPARFRPELVPEELMAPVLTLTVEEYVQTMEKLTTDMRFTLFNICYKRILIIWIATAFTILLCLLFSGFKGVQLFACGVAWLVLNASAIFICMWIKLKLNKQLEKCMMSINTPLLKHNLILGLDDRGKLSCHKVNLCFIYMEAKDCIKKLESILAETPEQNGDATFDREAYLREVENFDDVEVVVSGRAGVKIDRKQERAEKLFLHYIQRWAKDYLRRRLDWIVEDLYGRTDYTSNTNPRHLRTALCPCQYIEEHLRNKRQRESLNPCTISANPCHWCD